MTVDLYPPMIHEGDLSPEAAGSDIDAICNEIHEATAGFGTSEDRLLKAMGSMTPTQRCVVPRRYKELFDKDLKDVMRSECGRRDFGKALQFLAMDPVELDCHLIDVACKGMGTNELLLFTVLCGRTNKEMEILKKKYFDINSKDLGRKLDSELGGDLEQLILNILQACEEDFDPDAHTDDKVDEDVKAFYKMGQGKFGTDEKGLFKLLCALPGEHLDKVNTKYAEEHGKTLEKALASELTGYVEKGTIMLLRMKTKPFHAVSELVKTAVKGGGTNEFLFTTTFIRYHAVLKEAMLAHVEEYGKTFYDRVNGEISGDYEKIMKEILAAAGIPEEG